MFISITYVIVSKYLYFILSIIYHCLNKSPPRLPTTNVLVRREDSTRRESSSIVTMSAVSSPLRRRSPRFLNDMKVKLLVVQSDITDVSLDSMSRSFTADMHMS